MKKLYRFLFIAMLAVNVAVVSIVSAACTPFQVDKQATQNTSTKKQVTVVKPFPQHTAYTSGVIKPNHVSQDQLDNDVKRIYDEWKDRYLVQSEKYPNQYYVFYKHALKQITIEPRFNFRLNNYRKVN